MTFPSKTALTEATRAVHNLYAQYAGLGTLKEVLETYQAAASHYEGLQAECATVAKEVDEAKTQLAGLKASYTQRVEELEAQYAAACIPLVAHKEELEAEVAALSAKVEALDRETKTLASRRESLHNDIEAMLQRYRG